MSGRGVMYVGAVIGILLIAAWVTLGQLVAAIAFGQGFALGMVIVFVAVMADRARRRP